MEQAMDIENVLRRGIDAVSAAEDLRGLDEVRINYLGKKGGLTELLKGLGLEPQERPKAGAKINEAKTALQDKITERKVALEAAAMQASLDADRVDVTLPGRRGRSGGLHPVTQAMYRIESPLPGPRTRWSAGRRLKTITIISKRSTYPRITQRAPCTILFTSATALCCAPIRHPVRCVRWSVRNLRYE